MLVFLTFVELPCGGGSWRHLQWKYHRRFATGLRGSFAGSTITLLMLNITLDLLCFSSSWSVAASVTRWSDLSLFEGIFVVCNFHIMRDRLVFTFTSAFFLQCFWLSSEFGQKRNDVHTDRDELPLAVMIYILEIFAIGDLNGSIIEWSERGKWWPYMSAHMDAQRERMFIFFSAICLTVVAIQSKRNI